MARFLATTKLRSTLLYRLLDSTHTTDSKSKKQVDRAFHRWLRACKLLHDPPSYSTAAVAVTDPVLPSRPACQRDLPLAQALLSAGLTAEAAAAACETLGAESVAAAAAVAAGRYEGVVGGEDGGGSGRSGSSKRKKGPAPSSSSMAGGEELALHPLSRLEQPPVLRSKHHRPCLYLPLSAPALGERLEELEVRYNTYHVRL